MEEAHPFDVVVAPSRALIERNPAASLRRTGVAGCVDVGEDEGSTKACARDVVRQGLCSLAELLREDGRYIGDGWSRYLSRRDVSRSDGLKNDAGS